MFLHSLLMQEQTKKSQTRKPWYKRVMAVIILWKPVKKTPILPLAKTNGLEPNSNKPKLRKCTSLNVASSFTRVCLCAPISSYNEVFRADAPPRRSYSYPRSKPFTPTPPPPPAAVERIINTGTRSSVEGRRVFRGKSLTDDIMMRRFVLEEEAMRRRRRNQMEFIRRRNSIRRKKLGPSPLSRMSMTGDVVKEEEEQAAKEEENSP